MTRTVIALYDDMETANSAVQDLIEGNFNRDDISYIASDTSGNYARSLGLNRTMEESPVTTEDMSASGAAVNSISNNLIGLGSRVIPGIGPVVAAGPLAGMVNEPASPGAMRFGIVMALAEMGVPEEIGGYYAEGIRRGGTLVADKIDDHLSEQAVEILNRHHPVNLRERVDQWRQSGWTGFHPEETPQVTVPSSQSEEQIPTTGFGPGQTLPGNQGTMGTSQGYTNPSGVYGTDRDVYGAKQPDQPFSESSSGRTPEARTGMESPSGQMNAREIEAGGDTFGGEGTIGSEYGSTAPASTPMGGAGTDYGDYSLYDSRFRTHFQSGPNSRDYTYEDFAPAYRYGYDMAHDESYRGRTWEDVEPDVRRDWESQYPGTWNQFSATIEHAWQDVKDALE